MLINNGKNPCIIIPSDASCQEKFASEELKKYIDVIFGVNSYITSNQDSKYGFVLGEPKHNLASALLISAEEFEKEVPGPEGIFIKDFGELILISGTDGISLNYAVYEFLERYLGCCFGAYSNPEADAGEVIPRLQSADLSGIYYVKKCSDRPYRTAIVQYSNWAGNPDRALNIPFFDWLVKNRYNRILTWSSVYEFYKKSGVLKEIEKRGISLTVGHHESSRLFLPSYGNEYFPEHYYETHPEYYKLLKDGSRFCFDDHAGQWAFCSRNENAIEQVSKNVMKWLGQNPAVDTVNFWPNDGVSEQCMCPECSKYSKTENYCYFVNKVASIVKKEYPYIKFDILIYVDLWECPEGISLEDNIIIDESTWHKDGLRFFGKPDGTCLNGTHFEKNLLAWKNTGARVVYYDYYMGVYGLRQRLIPMADEVQAIWRNFSSKGIDGAGTQIECYNIWNHLFNFYSFGRCGYDASLSFDGNLKEFAKLFGKGGVYVEKIIRLFETCVDGQPKMHDAGHYLMEHINKEQIYSLYEKALESAENSRFRNNVRLLRMVFRYTDVETAEKLSKREEFNIVEKDYDDANGELSKMSQFDSFWKNNPGYGIMIPVESHNEYNVNDKWYNFE